MNNDIAEIVKVEKVEAIEIERRNLVERKDQLLDSFLGNKEGYKKYMNVALAGLGAIPWVGPVFGFIGAYRSDKDQSNNNDLFFLWLKEHENKLSELQQVFNYMFDKFESLGEDIEERIQSTEYLSLVRETFRQWDNAATLEKRDMLKKLIANSGGINLCSDDLISLFLNWIDQYHEFHFHVIKEIHKNSNISRGEIWTNLRGELPLEDSAEADLFKLLIRDLSTGGVIRQGSTLQKKGKGAFDYNDPYLLTELGSQFVHYVLTELTPQLNN